jgi:hypothetical protein
MTLGLPFIDTARKVTTRMAYNIQVLGATTLDLPYMLSTRMLTSLQKLNLLQCSPTLHIYHIILIFQQSTTQSHL